MFVSQRVKYLIIKNGFGVEVPVVFHESIEHAQVCRGQRVVAGGFFYLPDAESEDGSLIAAYGKSESCGVSSRQQDSEIIQNALFPVSSSRGDA